jgi:hypothetical protein
MKIPHAKELTLSFCRCFSAFSVADVRRGLHGTFMPRWAMVGGAWLNINIVINVVPAKARESGDP